MTGVSSLGYLGFTASDLEGWRELAEGVLGLVAVEGPVPGDGRLHLKMDERQWRLQVAPGDTNGVAFIGWEVQGPKEFAELFAQLEVAGVTNLKIADAAATAERGVVGLASFVDPVGIATEIFYGQKIDFVPFQSPVGGSGFKTEGIGLGHIFVMVPDNALAEPFYTEVLGFRLTDLIQMGGGKSARFYRCNKRHHSLVLMDLMPITKAGHIMLEVLDLDDVGYANDRARTSGAKIVNSLGRHTNDRMVSFYLRTPSDVDVELGWGAVEVDDATWTVTEFQGKGDLWGHHGEMMDEIAAARTD